MDHGLVSQSWRKHCQVRPRFTNDWSRYTFKRSGFWKQTAVILKLGMFAMGFFCLYFYFGFFICITLYWNIIYCACLYNCGCMFELSRSMCVTLLKPHGLCSSVHGILQARKLEQAAISSSRGSSQPRDQTQVSHTVDRFFTDWATKEAQLWLIQTRKCSLDIFIKQQVFVKWKW